MPSNENLAEYKEFTGATITVVAEGLDKPSGIDISGKRLFVSDYATGIIHVYNVENNEEIVQFNTNQTGNTGIEISRDGEIWITNYSKNTLSKITRN